MVTGGFDVCSFMARQHHRQDASKGGLQLTLMKPGLPYRWPWLALLCGRATQANGGGHKQSHHSSSLAPGSQRPTVPWSYRAPLTAEMRSVSTNRPGGLAAPTGRSIASICASCDVCWRWNAYRIRRQPSLRGGAGPLTRLRRSSSGATLRGCPSQSAFRGPVHLELADRATTSDA